MLDRKERQLDAVRHAQPVEHLREVVPTVFELMENCAAMSWFVDPATMADTISSWRAVKPKVGCGAAAPDAIVRSRMLSMMFPTHSRPTQY